MTQGLRQASGSLRLLGPALAAWAITAAVLPFPGAAAWVVGAVLLGTAGFVIAAVRPRTRRRARPWFTRVALFSAALGILSVSILTGEQVRADPGMVAALEDHESVRVEVSLDGFPAPPASYSGEPRSWVPASTVVRGTPLLLWLDGAPDETWYPGLDVTVEGRLSALDSVSSAALALSVERVEDPEVNGFTLGRVAAFLRSGLRETSGQVTGAELVPGLAIGDTSLVSSELDDAMRVSSLTHLTAVSGANCALITSAVMWLAARVGVPRRARILLAAIALGAFVTIVGPDSSVQRATVMAVVMLISSFGGKRGHGLAALGSAVILLLALDPWQAYQPGFALSVAATGGILVLTPALTKGLKRLRIPAPIAVPTAVAIAAQFACSPILILLEPSIPAAGVLANVIAGPAAPLGTGIGLLAALVIPFAQSLGSFLVILAHWPARWIESTAYIASELPFSTLNWVSGWQGALLMAGVQGLCVVAWAMWTGRIELARGGASLMRQPWERRDVHRARRRSPTLTVASVLASLALSVTFIVIVLVPLTVSIGTPKDWVVVTCDVGQGDAILVRDPQARDSVMLIDTGDDEPKLSACLQRFGVESIEILVLTHDDRDHVGALPVALPLTTNALIAPDLVTEDDRPIVEDLEEAGIEYVFATRGMRGTMGEAIDRPFAGVRWEVLSPERNTLHTDRNESSIVLAVRIGETSNHITMLALGDTGNEAQQRLLRDLAGTHFDLVKVAHHGSKDQHPNLYRELRSEYGLVSVGAGNGYGHPSPDTLALLDRLGTAALRTDEHGSIAISVRDGDIHIWVERS